MIDVKMGWIMMCVYRIATEINEGACARTYAAANMLICRANSEVTHVIISIIDRSTQVG